MKKILRYKLIKIIIVIEITIFLIIPDSSYRLLYFFGVQPILWLSILSILAITLIFKLIHSILRKNKTKQIEYLKYLFIIFLSFIIYFFTVHTFKNIHNKEIYTQYYNQCQENNNEDYSNSDDPYIKTCIEREGCYTFCGSYCPPIEKENFPQSLISSIKLLESCIAICEPQCIEKPI